MRLLDTRTGRFLWVDDPTAVRYAILSHTWSPEGEQSYQDVLKIQESHDETWDDDSALSDPALSPKIRGACAIALADGYDLVWIDSCCIDKSSSAELSEAVNSMFDWYRLANICYAYLSDVNYDDDCLADDSQFCASRWHTRGWTLQELIAPSILVFLSCEWRVFGTKSTLAEQLEKITAVDRDVLTGDATLDSVSVARRMSWAAGRRTTRAEDEAYSLMGIFGVRLPTIYGEGHRAFLRLQEEILKTIPDQSIFAWGPFLTRTDTLPGGWGLLARSPADYDWSRDISPVSDEDFAFRLNLSDRTVLPSLHYAFTPYGIRTRLYAANALTLAPAYAFIGCPARPRYITEDARPSYDLCAVLRCQDRNGRLLALPLCVSSSSTGPGLLVSSCKAEPRDCEHAVRTFALEQDHLAACWPSFSVMELCIQASLAPAHSGLDAHRHPGWLFPSPRWPRLTLAPFAWCVSVLERQGVDFSYRPPAAAKSEAPCYTHVIDLEKRTSEGPGLVTLSIHVRLALQEFDRDRYVVPALQALYRQTPRPTDVEHAPSLEHTPIVASRSVDSQTLSCTCGADWAHAHTVLSAGTRKVAWAHFELQHASDAAPGTMRVSLECELRSELDEEPGGSPSRPDFWLTVELCGNFFP
ncbi:HET-domain-containing protein [Trametes elegans]|nr:HET-domain-containing protein [Trametes elegans]